MSERCGAACACEAVRDASHARTVPEPSGSKRRKVSSKSAPLASTLPPLGLAAFVQVANQPIVRATIQLQDPSSTQPNVLSQLIELYRTRGWQVRI